MYIPKKRFWLVMASVSLVLVSSILSGMTFSKYEVIQNGFLRATLGDMLYNISKLKNPNEIVYALDDMNPGDSVTYTFSITNCVDNKFSDIPFEYIISIETYGNLPLNITLSQNSVPSGTGKACPTESDSYSSSEPALSLSSQGTMAVKTSLITHTYNVVVSWPANNGKVSALSDEVECLIIKSSFGQIAPVYN